MYAESDMADWAGRSAAGPDTADLDDTAIPVSEDDVPVEEAVAAGGSAAIAEHAQTLRDFCEIIKGDIRAAILDKLLETEDQDTVDDLCDALTLQAEALDELVTKAEAAAEAKAEEEAEALAEMEDSEESEDDEDDEDEDDDIDEVA